MAEKLRRLFLHSLVNMNNNNGGINKVFLVGQISRTPRWHKSDQNGTVLCFVLTTLETHQQKGNKIEQTEEHIIKIPEHRLEEELKLGQLLHIEGKLQTTCFVDEQSVRRYKTEVIVNKANVLG